MWYLCYLLSFSTASSMNFRAFSSHVALRLKFGMTACTISVPNNGLRIKGCIHSKVFTYMMQDEMGHPQMISNVNSFAGSHLEFPLGRHDLSLCPCDFDSSIQAGLVVSLHDIPAGFVCSNTTALTLRPCSPG